MIRINFHLEGDSRISFWHIKVTGIDVNGLPVVLYDEPYEDLTLTGDGDINLPTKRPQPIPSYVRPVAEIEEDAKFLEFQEHLLNNRAHYERALKLGSTEAQRAFELAKVGVGNGASLLEKVENRPLEVLGDYVAYPCIDGVWSDLIMNRVTALNLPEIPPVERLVTLPTRGVFSEAKLGHCNASEEIDPNRFWKWEEHPIPHMAPDIAPIQGVTPQPQQQNLSPTPFPQSLINIVNPPNAPDPTGLAGAMNVLAASNIFRDMSGRAEVADLLKKLSDNSVAIAGVAQKSKTGGVGGSGGGSSPSGNTASPQPVAKPSATNQAVTQTPEQKEDQQITNLDKKLDVADRLPPEQKKVVQQEVAKQLKKPPTKPQEPIGLGFLFTFQSAVYGLPFNGYATIKIAAFGKRAGEIFEPGTTIGPPSDDQITTIPEEFDVKVTNGNAMIQTKHATAPGTINITAHFTGFPDLFVQVVGSGAFYDKATSTFTLVGIREYEQPSSGTIVLINVQPNTIPKKVIAKNANSVVDELGTEAGVTIEVITAKATGKHGTTSSGENGEEFEVALMTGGMDIRQKNGPK